MDWIQFIAIFGSVIGSFVFLFREMKQIENRLDIKTEVQAARSDRLYEMFIDLLKEKR